MPDPLIPMSDRPRWETDPAPPVLAELMALALDVEGYDEADSFRRAVQTCAAVLDHMALPENRAALVGWLIAEGIATQPTVMLPDGFDGFPAVYADPSDPALNGCIDVWGTTENIPANLARPLFLLDGAP